MALFEFKNVSFSYAGSHEKVLENINFEINQGDFILIMGTSGSGKTTLLKHMKKCMAPFGEFSGEIYYKNKKLIELTKREDSVQIGYVGQDPDNQIVTDKVWHELAFGLENLGMSPEEIRRRSAETAAYFGIDGWYRKDTAFLSGGQKQLLNLVSVMIMQPEIIILDEPTAQLDPISAGHFIDTLVKLNRELGVTVVLTEHRTEQIFAQADKVVVIDNGRIVCNQNPRKSAEEIAGYYSDTKLKQICDSGVCSTEFDSLKGLPAAVRIYSMAKQELAERANCQASIFSEECPITVRDGRKWLRSVADKDIFNRNGSDKLKIIENQKNSDNQKTDNQSSDNKSIVNNKGRLEKSGGKVITAKDVHFRYQRHADNVLENVNFAVNKGEIFAILGSNGAGKSTLLKLISKVNKCVGGKIKTEGKVVMLSQNPMAMFTEISVEEELAQVMTDKSNEWAGKLNREEKLAEVEKMLEKMKLVGVRKHNPYDLSGGQQQKCAIAKALLLKPNILLLDEPTKGLDPYFKAELGKWLRELVGDEAAKENSTDNNNNITIVMVSHDIEFCAE